MRGSHDAWPSLGSVRSKASANDQQVPYSTKAALFTLRGAGRRPYRAHSNQPPDVRAGLLVALELVDSTTLATSTVGVPCRA